MQTRLSVFWKTAVKCWSYNARSRCSFGLYRVKKTLCSTNSCRLVLFVEYTQFIVESYLSTKSVEALTLKGWCLWNTYLYLLNFSLIFNSDLVKVYLLIKKNILLTLKQYHLFSWKEVPLLYKWHFVGRLRQVCFDGEMSFTKRQMLCRETADRRRSVLLRARLCKRGRLSAACQYYLRRWR